MAKGKKITEPKVATLKIQKSVGTTPGGPKPKTPPGLSKKKN